LRAIGWQAPPGPRQKPGPQPSATFTIPTELSPIGAGITAAPATLDIPMTRAAPINIVLSMVLFSLLVQPSLQDALLNRGHSK
jgi:hypothetical protein